MDPSLMCSLKENDSLCYSHLYYRFAFLEAKLDPLEEEIETAYSDTQTLRVDDGWWSLKGYLDVWVSLFSM